MAPNPPGRIVDAVTRVQRALRRAADLPLPAEAAFFQITNGQIAARVATTVAELKIADVIRDRSVPLREIAACIDADATALQRLLKAAASIDLVVIDKDSGDVRLTKQGQVLRSDHPASMREWAILSTSRPMPEVWSGLTASVRSGIPPFNHAHGTTLAGWLENEPAAAAAYSAGMRNVEQASAATIANAYPWPARGTVCDVGGGSGVVVAAILELRQDISAIVVDGKRALDEAGKLFESRELADRVTSVTSELADEFEADADVYLLTDVLHSWDDDECRRILNSVAAAMNFGSRLLIVEVADRVNEPNFMDPFVDLMMFAQTDGGRQRTVDELQTLLLSAGLTPTGRTHPAVLHTVIEAVRRTEP